MPRPPLNRPESTEVRAYLAERFGRSAARPGPLRDPRAVGLAADLAVGKPVIVYGWELGPHRPTDSRGKPVFYEVDSAGVLTLMSRDDLVARGWDLKPAAPRTERSGA